MHQSITHYPRRTHGVELPILKHTKDMNRKKRTTIGKYRSVYRGPIYEILQARAVRSDGTSEIFELITRPHGAAVVPIDDRGRVLLAREYRQRIKKYTWVFPGGRGERGETPRHTALRELQEEVGIKPLRLVPFHIFTYTNTRAWKDYYFLGAQLHVSSLCNLEDEDITLHAFTFTQAFRIAMSGAIENPEVVFVIIKLYRLRRRALQWARARTRLDIKFL